MQSTSLAYAERICWESIVRECPHHASDDREKHRHHQRKWKVEEADECSICARKWRHGARLHTHGSGAECESTEAQAARGARRARLPPRARVPQKESTHHTQTAGQGGEDACLFDTQAWCLATLKPGALGRTDAPGGDRCVAMTGLQYSMDIQQPGKGPVPNIPAPPSCQNTCTHTHVWLSGIAIREKKPPHEPFLAVCARSRATATVTADGTRPSRRRNPRARSL